MPWNERYRLGVPDMDATHREFVEAADALLAAPDAAFPEMFARLREHTRAHFEHEGKLMKTCRFPAIGEHHSEHLRVLGELAHFARGVAAGRPGMARNYVKSLPDGFNTHLLMTGKACCAIAPDLPLPRNGCVNSTRNIWSVRARNPARVAKSPCSSPRTNCSTGSRY